MHRKRGKEKKRATKMLRQLRRHKGKKGEASATEGGRARKEPRRSLRRAATTGAHALRSYEVAAVRRVRAGLVLMRSLVLVPAATALGAVVLYKYLSTRRRKTRMPRRRLPGTDLDVSVLSLGTWSFGGTAEKPDATHGFISGGQPAINAIVATALRCGINFFDAAEANSAMLHSRAGRRRSFSGRPKVSWGQKKRMFQESIR